MDIDNILHQAWSGYRQGDTATAVRWSQQAVGDFPEHGAAWSCLGACLERSGDLLAADRAFKLAARAKVEPEGRPYRISWRAFTTLVDQATAAIPVRFRPAFAELTVVLADYAEPYLLEGYDDPELLGMFEGTARPDAAQADGISPRIHLWRRAHEHSSSTAKEFRSELRSTLFHEFGHYLGYDEEDLERIGLA